MRPGGHFVAAEGADRVGKTYLVRRLADHTAAADAGVRAVLKDDVGGTGWVAQRLHALHTLTWAYDRGEPVWLYPSEYWLHTLAAWYLLFFHDRIQPALEAGITVVVDGWYLKHLARFQLTEESRFMATATAVFATLPQPDAVLVIEADQADLGRRAEGTKPSEAGAFGATTTDFATFQARTADVLRTVLAERQIPTRPVRSDAPVDTVLAMLAELDPRVAAR